jgi:hypothetical protein
VLEVEEVLVVKIEKIKEWKKGKQPETQQGKDTQKLKTVKKFCNVYLLLRKLFCLTGPLSAFE